MGMSNNDLVPLIARLVEEGGAVRIGGCGADSNSRRFFFVSSSPHSHLHFPAMMPSFPARINTSICHRRASLDHCTKRAFALQKLPLEATPRLQGRPPATFSLLPFPILLSLTAPSISALSHGLHDHLLLPPRPCEFVCSRLTPHQRLPPLRPRLHNQHLRPRFHPGGLTPPSRPRMPASTHRPRPRHRLQIVPHVPAQLRPHAQQRRHSYQLHGRGALALGRDPELYHNPKCLNMLHQCAERRPRLDRAALDRR